MSRHHFELSEVELHAPWASRAHHGLRIAQLSDVHLGPATPGERVLRAVARINALAPDLVFLTGDYVTRSRRPVPRIRELLGGLRSPTFVVLGNHDHAVDAGAVRREFEGLGYTVLQNAHASLKMKGARLLVLGIDDGHSRHDDVERTWRGAPEASTRLVLAHSPVTVTKLPARAGLICFSGHTHGGQLFVGRLTESVLRLAGQPYMRGLHEVNGNLLYVNRGLGFGRGSPLVRYRSPPELALFTLRTLSATGSAGGSTPL